MTLLDVVRVVYFFGPAYAADVSPILAERLLPRFDVPIDGGTKLRGQPILGASIQTLCNESRGLRGKRGDFVIGGIDDRTLGTPDWERLAVPHGPPHLLLAHHPDDFYEAERRGVALVLSGHTHGGQIRLPGGPPIVRQSHFCLDEGLYVHGSALLAVTRGLGAVGLPWRWGAKPEAVLLRVRAGASG
jgi:hypothetical protein